MADLVQRMAALRRPSSDHLLTPDQYVTLLANGRRSTADADIDRHPVVKLFTPDANATWLLTELDPDEPDRAFGLCDLGLGFAELGYDLILELRTVRGPLGFPVEATSGFVADRSLSAYAAVSHEWRRVEA